MDGDTTARLIYLGLLLASLGGWVLVEFRKRGSQVLRTGLAWALIVVGLMAGYGLWQDIRRDIRPAQVASQTAVTLPRASDGHYYADLTMAGQPIRFMVDTGASGIVLSAQDAQSLGIDPAQLVFMGQAMTANGLVRTASVVLKDVRLGPFQDEAVSVDVTEGDLGQSLLGMDYLGRFTVTMSDAEMVLTR